MTGFLTWQLNEMGKMRQLSDATAEAARKRHEAVVAMMAELQAELRTKSAQLAAAEERERTQVAIVESKTAAQLDSAAANEGSTGITVSCSP